MRLSTEESMIRLESYQEQAVERLRTGSILVGGVGTGKTLTSLAYFLIKVCGAKYKDGKFDFNGKMVPLYVITTAQKRDKHEWEEDASHLYSPLAKHFVVDSWNNIHKYQDIEDAFFIFDEQRLVGYGAWVKSFLKIAKNNKWILLSATPGDQWTDYIPVFVANGFYKNKTEFIRRHVVYKPFTNYPCIQRYLEEGVLLQHKRALLVDMDVNRSTVRHYMNVECTYDADLYKRTEDNLYNYIDDCMIESDSDFRLQLRRIINSDKSRIKAVLDIYQMHNKLIIFYNYNYELDILVKFCQDFDIPYSQWNGHRHEPICIGAPCWIYLVQYAAGAEGWNCIHTDTMIFYSLNYSYRMMEQASGRIDRMNTPYKDLHYYQLVTPGTIDDAVLRCIKRKKIFNEKRYFSKT